jgi:hypothetical protein
MNLSLYSNIGREWANAGLTLMQNKHMLSWGIMGHERGTTKIRSQGNLFYQPDIRLKNTNKCKKNQLKH